MIYGLKEIRQMARHEFTVLEAPPEMRPLTRIVCRETERTDVRAAFLDPAEASAYSDHLNGVHHLNEIHRSLEAKPPEQTLAEKIAAAKS